MEKIYTVGEIIYGLKPEYVKMKNELETLKMYLEISKNVDVDFLIATGLFVEPKMLYLISRKGLLGVLTEKLDRIIPHIPPEELLKYGNDYYVPEDYISINNVSKFSSEVDRLLSSEFAQNINFENEFGDSKLSIDSARISFCKENESLECHVVRENPSQIDLLSCEIPQSELPDYHIGIIEKNKSLKKTR